MHPQTDSDRRVQVSARIVRRGNTSENGQTPPEGDHQETTVEALIFCQSDVSDHAGTEEYQQECSHYLRNKLESETVHVDLSV